VKGKIEGKRRGKRTQRGNERAKMERSEKEEGGEN
jgi:hypothetical protein